VQAPLVNFLREGSVRVLNGLTTALVYLFSSLGSAPVFGDDDLMIIINNDSSDNLLVTVYDQSTSPPRLVLSRNAIYGNASISVSIAADRSGQGHLSWTATTVDRDMRMCGHKDKPNLNDGDTVNVHANNDCGG
jgi:hypothetical protein